MVKLPSLMWTVCLLAMVPPRAANWKCAGGSSPAYLRNKLTPPSSLPHDWFGSTVITRSSPGRGAANCSQMPGFCFRPLVSMYGMVPLVMWYTLLKYIICMRPAHYICRARFGVVVHPYDHESIPYGSYNALLLPSWTLLPSYGTIPARNFT